MARTFVRVASSGSAAPDPTRVRPLPLSAWRGPDVRGVDVDGAPQRLDGSELSVTLAEDPQGSGWRFVAEVAASSEARAGGRLAVDVVLDGAIVERLRIPFIRHNSEGVSRCSNPQASVPTAGS